MPGQPAIGPKRIAVGHCSPKSNARQARHAADAQGAFGIGLPAADTNLIGRTYAWNNAFQYRVFRKFWPEVELNSSFFQAGKNDGKKQTFVTPGLVIGRPHLTKRLGFTLGGGYQIAAPHVHASNHNAFLSIRFPF